MAERSSPVRLSAILKNLGFIVKNVPLAKKKAEAHFLNSIELAERFGYKGVLGKSHYDLGLLYKLKGEADKAKQCFSEAIEVFEQCESVTFLRLAKEALASLK
jgi:tetratricopeptide (TPR) repeat protein